MLTLFINLQEFVQNQQIHKGLELQTTLKSFMKKYQQQCICIMISTYMS